jgi:hypothetical protein
MGRTILKRTFRFGHLRLGVLVLFAGVLMATVLVGTAGARWAGSTAYVCSGLFQSIPPGSYGSVTVTGLCSIEGTVNISGGLTIASGAGLDASGPDCNSFVHVSGGVQVMANGVLFLGNGAGTGCPNSFDVVNGGLQGANALAVVVHGTTINGGFSVQGGGGGTSCADALVQGQDIGTPPFTDVEDSRINGGASISGMSTCWMGFIRNTSNGGVRVANNTMGDPDAIEIGLNEINGSLNCFGNALAFPGPGGVPTNSFDGSPPNPNVVHGQRLGQCAGV